MVQFNKGDWVTVTNSDLKTYKKMGYVTDSTCRSTRVQFKEYPHVLTYNNMNLRCVKNNTEQKEEKQMMIGKYDVAKIRFLNGSNTYKTYYYALYDDTMCAIGDMVVVKPAHHDMALAILDDVIARNEAEQYMLDSCNEGREIVCRIDMTIYNNRKEKREMAAKLKVEMDKKVKEMQELTLFEMMATKSPELKEMLDAYKSLIN
jgi:hypothetical protein